MNIHNHSIWPPPRASAVNSAVNAAHHGAFLQQSVCTALVLLVGHSSDDSTIPVINLIHKG